MNNPYSEDKTKILWEKPSIEEFDISDHTQGKAFPTTGEASPNVGS